jgi:tetratricopeptide (TPR) repeat protein
MMHSSPDARLKQLDAAVQARRAMLESSQAGKDDSRDILMENLATAVMDVYNATDDVAALREAIKLHEEIVDLRPIGHSLRWATASDLGRAFFELYEREQDYPCIQRSVALHREALALQPSAHPSRHWVLIYLAQALQRDFDQSDSECALLESIALHRQALALRPPGHPDRDESLNHLGLALQTAHDRQGDERALAEAITLHREALALRPTEHLNRVYSLNNLGYALTTTFERCGDEAALNEAIALHRESLGLRVRDEAENSDRATSLINLAVALKTRFDQRGERGDLAETIALNREALALRLPGQTLHTRLLNNLAVSLKDAHRQTGDIAALEEAAFLHRAVLTVRPPGHPYRSRTLSNLAIVLRECAEVQRSFPILEETIALSREALALSLPGNPLRAASLDNLAEALRMDFRQTRDLSTVRELVELQLEALSLRPPGHPLRPDMLGDTALSLETLYEASGGQCHPQTLLDARAMYTEGLQLCPVGHPSHAWLLINSSKCFFLVGSPVFDLAAGLQNLLAGLADDNCSARRRLQLCATALPAMERACDALAPLTAEHAQEALDAHRAAIHLLPRAANFGLTRQARLRTVTDSDALARHAAAHAVLACRVREAVEMLEEGRGVFWAQALHLRAAALDSVPEMERSELGRIFSILEQDGTGGPSATQRESEVEARRQLNEEAERIIAGIRARPGLERFLMPPAFDALIQSLPEGFVVVLLASTHGHQALLLDGVSHDVRSISLRPVTKTEDNEGEHAEEHASDNPERAIRVSRRLPTGIDVTLESLWSSIVYPVFSALNLKVRVHGQADQA